LKGIIMGFFDKLFGKKGDSDTAAPMAGDTSGDEMSAMQSEQPGEKEEVPADMPTAPMATGESENTVPAPEMSEDVASEAPAPQGDDSSGM
jgi:hypothetical protein